MVNLNWRERARAEEEKVALPVSSSGRPEHSTLAKKLEAGMAEGLKYFAD